MNCYDFFEFHVVMLLSIGAHHLSAHGSYLRVSFMLSMGRLDCKMLLRLSVGIDTHGMKGTGVS